MAFQKGNTYGKGRPKGSVNKTTAQIKEFLMSVSDALEADLFNDLQELQPLERVKVWLSIQEYLLPKLSRADISTGGDNLPPVINIHVVGDDEPILYEPK